MLTTVHDPTAAFHDLDYDIIQILKNGLFIDLNVTNSKGDLIKIGNKISLCLKELPYEIF